MPNVGNLYSYYDVSASPARVFTTTTTLSQSLPLYDNTGTELHRKVGTIVDVNSFTMLPTIVKFKSSGATSWYLDSNGDLYGCGDNTYGQQGISSATTMVTSFTKRASNVMDFDCSPGATWYITTGNVLYGCGQNDKHQQGNGSTTNVEAFTQRATSVSKIVTNPYTTWYITTSGVLYGCGNNNNGQQGDGTTNEVANFTQRATGVADVKTGGGGVTWYLTTGGALYGCGGNVQGNQGNGSGGTTTDIVKTFTQRATSVAAFDCSSQETWYLTAGGALYGCGRNNGGQQGIASSTARVLYFTQRATGVKKIACSDSGGTTWYITTNDVLYGCGFGTNGQQGNGSTTNVDSFTQRATNVKNVYAGGRSTWYTTNDNKLYGCGVNANGNQGTGDTNTVTSFTQRATNVAAANTVQYNPTPLSYTYATWYVNNYGELYGCGANDLGQQGNGTTTDVLTFAYKAG